MRMIGRAPVRREAECMFQICGKDAGATVIVQQDSLCSGVPIDVLA